MDDSSVPNSATPPSLNVPPPPSALQQTQKRTPGILYAATITALLISVFAAISAGLWGSQQRSQVDHANTALQNLKQENRKLSQELDAAKPTTGEEHIDTRNYQAVFLTSQQVYFGKITKLNDAQLTLEDIYYLRTNTPSASTNVGDPEGTVSLVKLGDELHGPQDVMYIERKDVSFWENLKADSKVSKAIRQYRIEHPKVR